MMAPTIHEKIAAGPAIWAAFSAPNSQPEPMIAPTPVNSRLSLLTSFLKPVSSATSALRGTWGGAAIADTFPFVLVSACRRRDRRAVNMADITSTAG